MLFPAEGAAPVAAAAASVRVGVGVRGAVLRMAWGWVHDKAGGLRGHAAGCAVKPHPRSMCGRTHSPTPVPPSWPPAPGCLHRPPWHGTPRHAAAVAAAAAVPARLLPGIAAAAAAAGAPVCMLAAEQVWVQRHTRMRAHADQHAPPTSPVAAARRAAGIAACLLLPGGLQTCAWHRTQVGLGRRGGFAGRRHERASHTNHPSTLVDPPGACVATGSVGCWARQREPQGRGGVEQHGRWKII
jgi:hypothetical protein